LQAAIGFWRQGSVNQGWRRGQQRASGKGAVGVGGESITVGDSLPGPAVRVTAPAARTLSGAWESGGRTMRQEASSFDDRRLEGLPREYSIEANVTWSVSS
jgi:hypothetical protein